MSLQLTWFGHSAFQLEADGQTVLIDPFITGNPVGTVNASDLSADTILLTHGHNDHVGDTVAIAKRTHAKVIGTVELMGFLGSEGVDDAVGANFGGTVAFAGGTVKFVPAWHSSSYTTANGLVAPGIPAGLVVRFGGMVIYFAGDTCLFLDMQLIGEEGLHLAILPIGDHFTMGPTDAARAAKLLGASTVIPCHYNTFPPIKQDASAFKHLVESTTASKVVVMTPGETINLDQEQSQA